MDYIIFFAATSAVDSLDKEALQHIIQLVILCIPLLTLPLILKSSASVMGRVSGMAETASRQAGKKGGAASRKIPVLRRVPEGFDDWKQGREERYKYGVATRRAKRAGGKLGSYVAGGITETGRNRAEASGINQLAGMKKSDLEAQKVLYSTKFNDSDDTSNMGARAAELERAIKSGDSIKIKAMMDIMASGGKGEIAVMGDTIRGVLRSGEISSDARNAINSARKDNWPDIKGADPGFAASSLSAGYGPQAPLDITAPQFKTMSPSKIAEYGVQASNDTLMQVRENNQIWSDMDDKQKAAWSSIAESRGIVGQQPTTTTPPAGGPTPHSVSDIPRGASGGGNWEQRDSGLVIPRDRK
jgi:hypothetical protein